MTARATRNDAAERRYGPVRFLPGPQGGKYPFCHAIYVDGPGLLIDPSCDRERLVALREGPGVREIWLTHWHEDHFMHLDLFDDLPLAMSAEDAPPLGDLERFLDWYGSYSEEHRDYWRRELVETFHFRPRVPTRTLMDGQRIELAPGLSVMVIATPGHTPGHLAFHFIEPDVLIMGDYELTAFGPYYGDHGSNIEQFIASTRRLQRHPARIKLAAHETGVFENPPDRLWDDYLAVIATREQALLAFLAQPRTLEEIVGAWLIWRRPRQPPAFYEVCERGMQQQQLEHLRRQGRVECRDGRWRRLDHD